MDELGSSQAPLNSLPSSPKSEDVAFKTLLALLPAKKKPNASKFVKKLENIPKVSLPPKGPIKVALSLAERALVGQFTGLSPSPKP